MAEAVVRELTADEAVKEFARIGRRLSHSDATELARLIRRDVFRATRVLNERLIGKPLSDDEVLQILREVIRDLATAGDA